jgi:acetylornithine/N-succinyldiaminopimelate aminotransferase
MTNRQLFLNHLGQTSPSPLAIEIARAQGCKLWDVNGREYIDLIGGISVCNTGHRHPKVIKAINNQLDNYMHVMVYGELVQSPQTSYAKLLTDNLPASLNTVFFTASGTEATEGAMKLAKRYTGRTQIIAFKNSYHGSTQGSLSVMGDEYWRNAFRPLLPDILHLNFNSFDDLNLITEQTACVIAETIQAEAGVIVPENKWLKALREKCTKHEALLVLDEIQCGFGRNGTLWAFEQFDAVPDILLLGKALGGGMPMGAFIADKEVMRSFTNNPVLGNINTFGGHPVCCAAGLAAMQVLADEDLITDVREKENLFLKNLIHSKIKTVRSCGLMIAVQFKSFSENKSIIDALLKVSADIKIPNNLPAIFTDWFLFAPDCLRIVPPLIISKNEINTACEIIISALDTLTLTNEG